MSDESDQLLAVLRGLKGHSGKRGQDYVRSPFGFPGAKSRSLKELMANLPYRHTWADVFGGSGTVTLARNESPLEVFNDRHAGISCFFRVVQNRDSCQKLVDWLEHSICSRETWMVYAEEWKKKDQHDEITRAGMWYYTVQHSFASKGWSFGRSTTGRSQCGKLHGNLKFFWPMCHRLRKVYVENQDWQMLVHDYSKNKADIVWYFDPPYWGTEGIYDHELPKDKHFEIAQKCMELRGFCAVSGYDSPDHPYNKYKWDRKIQWDVMLSMTGFAFTESNNLADYEGQMERGFVKETLWIKDNP